MAGQPRRSGRVPLGAIWPAAIVVAIAAAWSCYWYLGHSGQKLAFERWQAHEARAGREFHCDDVSHGGFPFRFEMTCGNPRMTIHDGDTQAVVRAKTVRTIALAYAPNQVIAEFDGPLYIERDDGSVIETAWNAARMSMRISPILDDGRLKVSRADLQVDAPLVNLIASPGRTSLAYRAEAFEAHVRASEAGAGYDLAASSAAPSLTLPDGTQRAVDRAQFVGSASQIPALASGDWSERLARWRDAGGVLTVNAARIDYGDSLAILDGMLRLDGAGRPEGRINLTTAGVDLANVAGEDMLGLSGIAALSIGALGSPVVVDGRAASRIGLRMQGGTLFLGPLGLAELPSLLRH